MSTYNKTYKLRLFPDMPAQVPHTESLERVIERMLEGVTTEQLNQMYAVLYKDDIGLIDKVGYLNSVVQKEGAPAKPNGAGASLAMLSLTWLNVVSLDAGKQTNSNNITIIDPGVNTPEIVVDSDGISTTVTLAWADGAITSTVQDVADYISFEQKTRLEASVTGTGSTLAIAVEQTFFSGGQDGTPGAKGEMRWDEDNLYISIDESTELVSNWKTIPFSVPEE